MISFANVPLCDLTPEQSAFLHFWLPPSRLFDLSRPAWPGRNLTGLSFPYGLDDRTPQAQSLFWPVGASRFAVGYFFATDAQLNLIRPVVYGGSSLSTLPDALPGYIPAALVINDGRQSITTDMYMLPPRPVAQCFLTPPVAGSPPPAWLNGLWLLTLVDERYFWWRKAAQIEVQSGHSLSTAVPVDVGSGYSLGGVLTLVGGTFTTVGAVTITGLAMNFDSIGDGGVDYTAGDILTVSTGTGSPAIVQAATVGSFGEVTSLTVLSRGDYTFVPISLDPCSGGTGTGFLLVGTYTGVGSVSVTQPGTYSVFPTNPVSVTGGGGTGATLAIGISSGWIPLFQDIATALAITLPAPTIPSAYLNPPVDLTNRYDQTPILFDAAAYSCGLCVVRDLAGNVTLQTAAEANTSWLLQYAALKSAGGNLLLDGNAAVQDTPGVLPLEVALTFGITFNTFPDCPPYVSRVDVRGLGLTPAQPCTFINTRYFHTTCCPAYDVDGELLNQTEMDALATQFAHDWCEWQLGALDVVFSGSLNWVPEGQHDVLWEYLPGVIGTRVQRGPWDDGVQEVTHAGSYGSAFYAQISAVVLAKDTELTGDLYDAVIGTYDVTLDIFDDAQPCWLSDPTGSATISLTTPYAGCTLVGSFQGRPIYALPVQGSGGVGSDLTVRDVSGHTVTGVNVIKFLTGTVSSPVAGEADYLPPGGSAIGLLACRGLPQLPLVATTLGAVISWGLTGPITSYGSGYNFNPTLLSRALVIPSTGSTNFLNLRGTATGIWLVTVAIDASTLSAGDFVYLSLWQGPGPFVDPSDQKFLANAGGGFDPSNRLSLAVSSAVLINAGPNNGVWVILYSASGTARLAGGAITATYCPLGAILPSA